MTAAERIIAAVVAPAILLWSGPALAGAAHCYTMGAAQMIVPDLFNQNPGARKLGLTAENVTLGGEFIDDPGACYVEITTNTGIILKYKFRLDGATGHATLDAIGGAQ